MAHLVSVIIINHNGIDFVDNCLQSVLNSNYPSFEIIFVDNGSSDSSLEFVKNNFGDNPRLRILENKASLGPAVGRNRGAAAASGKYFFFLDNDTQVNNNCIAELIKVMESDPSIGAGQAKLLQMDSDNLYDCAGDYLGPLGFLIERSQRVKDIGQFDSIADILSAKSAASIIRKDLFDKIGGFDESYYMYLEETDLSWRVWLAGYRVVFSPKSVVYHAYGTKKKLQEKYYSNYTVRYYGCRNYISTLIKNFGTLNLFKILPLHIISWLLLSAMFLIKGRFKDFIWIIKAIFWNISHMGLLLKKRAQVQKVVRRAGDKQIMSKVMALRPLSYYLGKAVSYIYGRPY